MKIELKILCVHEDGNMECDFIEEGDLNDLYFKCPKCGREIVQIVKIPEEAT